MYEDRDGRNGRLGAVNSYSFIPEQLITEDPDDQQHLSLPLLQPHSYEVSRSAPGPSQPRHRAGVEHHWKAVQGRRSVRAAPEHNPPATSAGADWSKPRCRRHHHRRRRAADRAGRRAGRRDGGGAGQSSEREQGAGWAGKNPACTVIIH